MLQLSVDIGYLSKGGAGSGKKQCSKRIEANGHTVCIVQYGYCAPPQSQLALIDSLMQGMSRVLYFLVPNGMVQHWASSPKKPSQESESAK